MLPPMKRRHPTRHSSQRTRKHNQTPIGPAHADLAAELHAYKLDNHLSYRQLAELIGHVDQRTVGRFVKNRNRPHGPEENTVHEVERFLKGLG